MIAALLTAVIVFLGSALAAMTWLVVRLLDEAQDDGTAAHAKCIAHIADVTSKRVVAVALRDLSERYDSVPEQAKIRTMARQAWSKEGPSIPALWLMKQADLLDPPADSQPALHTLDGRRVL